MLYETGRVVAVESDGLWVETLKQSACAQCAAKAGCGQKLLNNFAVSHNMTLIKAIFSHLSPHEEWGVGDQVLLGIDRQALVKAALLTYMLPLVLMLLGICAGFYIYEHFDVHEATSVIGGALGLLGGAFLVRLHSSSATGKSCYQAHVVGKSIISEDSAATAITIENQ